MSLKPNQNESDFMVSHYEEKELQSIVPILTNLDYFQNTTHQVNAEDLQYSC
jgi:hypothetical protein